MNQVNAQRLKTIAASYPAFTCFDGILAFIFPNTTRQHRTTGVSFKELAPEFNWDEGAPWVDKNRLDISISYLPRNLVEFLPADAETQEWPWNFVRWAIPENLGLHSEQLRNLLPVVRNEIEAIIAAYDCIEGERDRKLIICHDIHMMLLKLVYYFTPPEDIKRCIERIEWWTNYMKDVAGCIDEDGILDRESACLNSLCREWGVEQ